MLYNTTSLKMNFNLSWTTHVDSNSLGNSLFSVSMWYLIVCLWWVIPPSAVVVVAYFYQYPIIDITLYLLLVAAMHGDGGCGGGGGGATWGICLSLGSCQELIQTVHQWAGPDIHIVGIKFITFFIIFIKAFRDIQNISPCRFRTYIRERKKLQRTTILSHEFRFSFL